MSGPLPRRYVSCHQGACDRPKEVSPLIVRRAFSRWDGDQDGEISASDLIAFIATKPSLTPPEGGWARFAYSMFLEGTERRACVALQAGEMHSILKAL